MSQPNRIAGGLIDRSTEIAFTFNGKTMRGHPGDTLASALLANGQRLVGRSFKYHRPRGIFTAGSEEPNALVELRQAAPRRNPTPAPPPPSCSTGFRHAARTTAGRSSST